MERWTGFALMLSLGLVTAGCEALEGILLPTTVTVSLVNDSSDFDVEVTLRYDDEDDIPELLLTQIGTEREFTVAPGQTATFTRSCDDLQAVMIEDAELLVVVGIGPDTDTGVLRIDDHFECGDEIVFTFTHSDVILDFAVTTQIRPGR